jgi:hypothetical protein
VSTNASAERACSPVVEGVGAGLGEGVGLGVGADAVLGAGPGLREGPNRRERVEESAIAVEEDCAVTEAAILAVAPVDVARCTTLQPTAAIIRAIVISR